MAGSAKSSGSTGVLQDMPVGSAVPVSWAWLASPVAGVRALSFSYQDHCVRLHCHIAPLGNRWQRWRRYLENIAAAMVFPRFSPQRHHGWLFSRHG